MQRQGSGAIVNNASVGALTGNPGIGSYIASKRGVVGLTRTADLEYIKQGIRVNVARRPGLADAADAKSAGTWYLGGSTPPPGTTSKTHRICG